MGFRECAYGASQETGVLVDLGIASWEFIQVTR
jgi:hypothetical protein